MNPESYAMASRVLPLSLGPSDTALRSRVSATIITAQIPMERLARHSPYTASLLVEPLIVSGLV